jgi:hypothetical protein
MRVCLSEYACLSLKQNKNKGEKVVLDFACGHFQPPSLVFYLGFCLWVLPTIDLPIISYCQSIT